ncbi:hypothetical protein LTR08_008937 [Meristemomyces frigidus]|nr:hypothetical protein LTR08_008937 [Meristemomyces frigidus]
MITETDLKPWLRPPPRRYRLVIANVVDVVDGSIRENATVTVENGLIKSIEDSAEAAVSQAHQQGFRIINCRNKFLCPGLIDSHVHLMAVPGFADLSKAFGNPNDVSVLRQPYVCAQMLQRGFTTVRDCGGASLALKEAIQDSVFPGPRLFIAGHALSQSGGHADYRSPYDHAMCCGGTTTGLGRICNGVAECMQAVREEVRTGADFIKIMGSGGVSSPTDKIDHLQFTGAEIRAMAECAANAGTYVTAYVYTSQAIRHCIDNGARGIEYGNFLNVSTAKLMADKGCFLAPTLVTYAEMASPRWQGYLPSRRARMLKFLKPDYGPSKLRRKRESLFAMVRTSWDRSAKLRQGGSLYARKFVIIKAGYEADILILAPNPLEDVKIFDDPEKNILAIMKEGRLQKTRSIDTEEDELDHLFQSPLVHTQESASRSASNLDDDEAVKPSGGEETLELQDDDQELYDNPKFQRHTETTNAELFYDLFFVANLTVFTTVHEVNDQQTLAQYVGFFCILTVHALTSTPPPLQWFTWYQVGLYDVRSSMDSVFERVAKASQFGVIIGFAITGPKFDVGVRAADSAGDGPSLSSFRALSLILMAGRLVLVLQYLQSLWFTRHHKRTQLLIAATYFVAAMIYLGLFFTFRPDGDGGDHTYITWYVVAVLETVIATTVSSIWRVISFKGTHLVQSMSLLTLIILGEGVMALAEKCQVLVRSGVFQFTASIIGNIISAILTLYFIDMLYFDWIQEEHFGTIRQQLWALLHFPLHLLLVPSKAPRKPWPSAPASKSRLAGFEGPESAGDDDADASTTLDFDSEATFEAVARAQGKAAGVFALTFVYFFVSIGLVVLLCTLLAAISRKRKATMHWIRLVASGAVGLGLCLLAVITTTSDGEL